MRTNKKIVYSEGKYYLLFSEGKEFFEYKKLHFSFYIFR